MNARQEFVEHIRASLERAELYPVPAAPNIFVRRCSSCNEDLPHYQFADHCECSVCQRQTFKGEQGSSCLEFIFLLALVVFVLVVVLKDVPW